MKPTPRSDRETEIILHAVEFTCVRGVLSNRTVTRHATLEAAVASAVGDGRTMVYAIDATGATAHVQNI